MPAAGAVAVHHIEHLSGGWRWVACLASVLGCLVCLGGPPEPRVLRVSPPQDATNAAPAGGLVLVFDQPMDTTVPPLATLPGLFAGNHDVVSPAGPIRVSGSWGADRRTLVLRPDAALPLGTPVTWTLNPQGAVRPLRSAMGEPLTTVTGSFRIAPDGGGSASEECPPPTAIPTTYTISKLLQYHQQSSADPLPLPGQAAVFGVTVQPAVGAPEVLGGSVTGPGGGVWDLAPESGQFRLLETYASASALESARPGGAYTLRIHRLGSPERVIALAVPPMPGPVPKVANHDAAQAVDATRDFTLRWAVFGSGDAGALVRVILSDASGRRLFLAPDACGRRPLDPAADSVVIPAGFLRPGFTYQGQLVFAVNFHKFAGDAGQLAGNGFVQRVTSFSLKTRGDSGEPPREWCALEAAQTAGYSWVKRLLHRQIASDRVAPCPGIPAFVAVTVQGPPGEPEVTAGELTFPDGTLRELPRQADGVALRESGADLESVDLGFPPGNYTLRFSRSASPEQVVALSIPAAPVAIPQILNFPAAQEVDADADFTLEWEAFTPQPSGAFVRITLFDRQGQLVYLSPNPCISRTLPPGATSATMPAGTFRPGEVYEGLLSFGVARSPSSQGASGLPGGLRVERSTAFTLRTRDPGGPHQGVSARLSGMRIRADGIPEFLVSGPPHASFRVHRTSELPGSSPMVLPSVQMDASGMSVVEDPAGVLEMPVWYQALGD